MPISLKIKGVDTKNKLTAPQNGVPINVLGSMGGEGISSGAGRLTMGSRAIDSGSALVHTQEQ